MTTDGNGPGNQLCVRCPYQPPMTARQAKKHTRWHTRDDNRPEWREALWRMAKEGRLK